MVRWEHRKTYEFVKRSDGQSKCCGGYPAPFLPILAAHTASVEHRILGVGFLLFHLVRSRFALPFCLSALAVQRDTGPVLLCGAWSAPAVVDVLLHQLREPSDDFRLRGGQIAGFAQIVLKIVEFPLAAFEEDEFPRPLADGQIAVRRLMDGRLADRALRGSQQVGQDADAVLGGVVGQLGADDFGAGGQQVVETDRVVADAAGLDLAGPAGEERLAVAAFVDARLAAAQRRDRRARRRRCRC